MVSPLVSVIVRTKDRPIQLRACLKSICEQDYRPIQVIVINDGGCDVTEITSGYQDDFDIQLKQLSSNIGRTPAANLGLKTATGDYLTFLDDDDYWLPNHLSLLISEIFTHHNSSDNNEQYPYCAAYGATKAVSVNGDGDEREISTYQIPFDRKHLLYDNYLPIMSVLFSRQVVDSGITFDESFDLFEDWDFWLQVSAKLPFYFVNKITSIYQLHDNGSGVHQKERVETAYKAIYQKWMQEFTAGDFAQLLRDTHQWHAATIDVLQTLNQEQIQTIGNKHSYALSIIKQKDQDISTLEKSYKNAIHVIKEKDQASTKLASEYNHAIEVIQQKDSLISQLQNEFDNEITNIQTEATEVKQALEHSKHLLSAKNRLINNLTEELQHYHSGYHSFTHKIKRSVQSLTKRKIKESTMPANPTQITDVIIPVYRGLEETRECLESALRTLPSETSRLIVINDSSPEPEVTGYLRRRANEADFTLLENEENLGFVATVNRGMSLNPEHDVLLLNSDVEVANNWLERIIDAAYSEKTIGSVTPFANNATICSFPNFCEDNELFENLSVGELDRICSDTFPQPITVDVPTGVGFCMFIKRACLNEVGLFDVETFGKGYGEENDWCQRAIKSGWRNVHQMNVFAYHKGGVSFAEEQDPRKDRALELLNELHPNYQQDVHQFIANDPAKPYRIEFLLALIAQDQRPKVLSIDHGLGGGVGQHVEELADHLKDQIYFLRLAPYSEGIVKLSFSPTTYTKDSLLFNIEEQYQELVEILKYLNVGHIHFHHTMGLPTRIWGLSEDINCLYDITIHDYYHINGNPSLTDKHAIYCGDTEDRDEKCAEHYPIPVPANQWRKNQSNFLFNASRVIFPSFDTRDRFKKDFALNNDVVAWHPDLDRSAPLPDTTFTFNAQLGQPLRILILGAISRWKGADILEKVADSLKERPIEFHLLGYAYRPLSDNVITHGPYVNKDIYKEISTLKPHAVWFPAQCPETYSYTLSIAIKAGLPVIAPDLGAFTERLSGRNHSVIMPWQSSIDTWKNFFNALYKNEKLTTNTPDNIIDGHATFYKNGYSDKNWIKKHTAPTQEINIQDLLNTQDKNLAAISIQKKLWNILVRANRNPITKKLSSCIPIAIKHKIRAKLL